MSPMSRLDAPPLEPARTASSSVPSSSPPATSYSMDPSIPLPHTNTNTNVNTVASGRPLGRTAEALPEQSHTHAMFIQELLSNHPSFDPETPFELELTTVPLGTELLGTALSPAAPGPSPTTASSRPVIPFDRVSTWHDARHLFIFALPNIAVVLMVTLSGFFSTMLVGRLGAEYLGALTLARTITNLTGNNIAQGAASALEALCSHAYGAGIFPLVGRWTQRCMLLLTLMCIPTFFIWMQTERILLGLGIGSTEAALAGRFALISTAGIWPFFMFECLRRHLQSCGMLWPVVVSTCMSTAVTITLTYLLLSVWHMGIEGAAISWVAAQWACVIMCVTCIVSNQAWRRWRCRPQSTAASDQTSLVGQMNSTKRPCTAGSLPDAMQRSSPIPSPSASPLPSSPQSPTPFLPHPTEEPPASKAPSTAVELSHMASTWPSPIDRAVLRDWSPLLRLALPGALSAIMELGAFQCTSVVAARFSRNCLATHSIFMQTTALLYVIPMGFANGSSIAIGQMIGAGRGQRAWEIIRLSYFVHVCYPLISGGILVLFLRHIWPSLFSSDAGVLKTAASAMPILLLYLLSDDIRCLGKSVLRSCGRNKVTAYGHIFSCWIIGLPLIYIFCFPLRMGLFGLWLGMSLTWFTAAAIFVVLLVRTNWDALVKKVLRATLAGTRKTEVPPLRSATEEGKPHAQLLA